MKNHGEPETFKLAGSIYTSEQLVQPKDSEIEAEMHFAFNLFVGAIKNESSAHHVKILKEQIQYYFIEEKLKITPYMAKCAEELVPIVGPKDLFEFVEFFKLGAKFDKAWFKTRVA